MPDHRCSYLLSDEKTAGFPPRGEVTKRVSVSHSGEFISYQPAIRRMISRYVRIFILSDWETIGDASLNLQRNEN